MSILSRLCVNARAGAIWDIRQAEVSHDPDRITTIMDEKLEYVINSFLLRKIQHPDRCCRSTIVQMGMLRDELFLE